MLRKTRIALGAIFFLLITLLFLDVSGVLHHFLGWMAKVQLVPAIMAVNLIAIAVLAVLTLLFGRIYCSVICPMGVMQDVVAWIGKKRRKNRYTYSKAINWLRYTMLALMVVAMIIGVPAIVALLDPYSSYGRIATNLFQPLYGWGNNLLAAIAERADSYAFYSTEVWIRSLLSVGIAAVTLIAIGILAWRNGRTYCNTICPVGTLLGLVSRFSLFKVRFDADKCRNCSLCSKNCKASCIDYTTHKVDYSRCVACGNCIVKCNFGALRYTASRSSRKQSDNATAAESSADDTGTADRGRRTFLMLSALTATTALAQEAKKVDGGLAVITQKKAPHRSTRIVPPGAVSLKHLSDHCTSCQLCIAECPNQVLRPSTELATLMQPYSSYERGYCRPECSRCSHVCPAGAILPVTHAEKSSIQIGHAKWIKKNCLPVTDGVSCGNCAKHCPTGAIEMVALNPDDEESPQVPAVNEARCIGCGACENLCPAAPFSAIFVEGHEVHKQI